MTQQIKQINILDMMKMYGEDSCKTVLSTFMCPLNLDVEDFIHNKAIEFARQRIAITFLVFKECESGSAFVGYYTLANKFVSIAGTHLSKTLQKKIAKFSQYDDSLERFMVSIVATRFCRPIINPVACHGINRYNDMRTEKGKGSRTPAFSREPCSETTIKTMIIISKYEVEYKEEEDIFHQQ